MYIEQEDQTLLWGLLTAMLLKTSTRFGSPSSTASAAVAIKLTGFSLTNPSGPTQRNRCYNGPEDNIRRS